MKVFIKDHFHLKITKFEEELLNQFYNIIDKDQNNGITVDEAAAEAENFARFLDVMVAEHKNKKE